MKIEQGRVLRHEELKGGYRLLSIEVPAIAKAVGPGQFIHLQVPKLAESVLRRPFSVLDADDTSLSVIFKIVGKGTAALTYAEQGDEISIMGPLGQRFPQAREGTLPLLIGGGYGVAPLHFFAKRSPVKGIMMVGSSSKSHILCAEEFRMLEWDFRISTEDGSMGMKGRVTDLVEDWVGQGKADATPVIYSCGPHGMLKAIAEMAKKHGWKAWLSMDRNMACGVGACLACVQKVKKGDKIEYVRVCKEGPVFDASDIIWE